MELVDTFTERHQLCSSVVLPQLPHLGSSKSWIQTPLRRLPYIIPTRHSQIIIEHSSRTYIGINDHVRMYNNEYPPSLDRSSLPKPRDSPWTCVTSRAWLSVLQEHQWQEVSTSATTTSTGNKEAARVLGLTIKTPCQ